MKNFIASRILKYRWIWALLFGGYKQTRGNLCDEDGHCCLGVLAEVCGLERDGEQYRTKSCVYTSLYAGDETPLHEYLANKEGNPSIVTIFSEMNDAGESFRRIAWKIFKRV